MSKCLGLDIGYGFTKTYDGGKTKIFTTAVTAIVPKPSFSDNFPVIVNNTKFLVGEEAEREGGGLLETRSSNFVMSDAWLAILGRSLSLNEFDPKDSNLRKSVLVLGIPPGLYSKAQVKKIIDTVRQASITDTLSGTTFELGTCIIKVIPQGSGIYFSYIDDNPEDLAKNIAVLDIGHHTLDMIYFSNGKYIETMTDSRPLGISIVLDNIMKAFYKRYGFIIQYPDARQLLAKDSLTFQRDIYQLEDIQDIILPYAQQLTTIIDTFFEKRSIDLGVAGGGGVLMLKGIIKLKRKLDVIVQPEMANAIGYYNYGENFIMED